MTFPDRRRLFRRVPRRPRVEPFVTFTPVFRSGLRPVRVLLGDGTAKATADAGWSFVSRLKNKGFTTWEGYAPYVMTIPVTFDGFAGEVSQEQEYEALRRIQRVPTGPTNQPSPVRVAGPLPLTNLLWVVQNLEEDSAIRRERDGNRIRIIATVTLMEYVEPDVLVAVRPSPARAAQERATQQPGAAAAAPTGRTYTVKRGDTLSRIAQRQLGSYKRYTEIARLNGIRDPNRIRPGQVLRLP